MHLSYNLHKLKNALTFQVTAQSDPLTDLLQSASKFIASNGWTIKSSKYVGIDMVNNIIYVRGRHKYLDLQPDFVYGLSDESVELLEIQIVQALEEMIMTAIETGPVERKRYTAEIFNTSRSNKNHVDCNKETISL